MTDGVSSPSRRAYRSPVRAAAAAATGERIVEAALARFSAQPYEEVALEDVARDAGVAVRTVIRRFGSKDGLLTAVAERVMTQRNEAPVDDVPAAVRNVLEHYEEWGDRTLRMIAQEDRIPAIKRHIDGGRALHRDWVERTFAPLVDDYEGDERERRVLALVAATDLYVWKLLRRDLGLDPDVAQKVIETLIAGAR